MRVVFVDTKSDAGARRDAAMMAQVEARGMEVYERAIRPDVEPTRNGAWVAIHVATGAWEVAAGGTRARLALRERFPSGHIFSRRIGPESMDSLSWQMRSSLGAAGTDPQAGAPK